MSYFQRVYRFRLPTTDWLQEWLVERSSFVAVQTSDGNFNVSKDLPRFSIFNQVFDRFEYVWMMENTQDLVRCEPTSWGSQTLRNLLRLMQVRQHLVWIIEAVSAWHLYFEVFSGNFRKSWKHQQHASDFICAPQPFGLEPWLSLWSRS